METTTTPGHIIHMEAHQFEKVERTVNYNKLWGKLEYNEDEEPKSAYFIQHPDDAENAFCLN